MGNVQHDVQCAGGAIQTTNYNLMSSITCINYDSRCDSTNFYRSVTFTTVLTGSSPEFG